MICFCRIERTKSRGSGGRGGGGRGGGGADRGGRGRGGRGDGGRNNGGTLSILLYSCTDPEKGLDQSTLFDVNVSIIVLFN